MQRLPLLSMLARQTATVAALLLSPAISFVSSRCSVVRETNEQNHWALNFP